MSEHTTSKSDSNESGMDVATELSLMLARLDNLESELSKEDDTTFDIEMNTMQLPERVFQQEPLPTSRDRTLIQSHITELSKEKPCALTLQMIFNRHKGFLEELSDDADSDQPDDPNGSILSSDDEDDTTGDPSSTSIPSSLLARLLRLEFLALSDMQLTSLSGLELMNDVKVIMLQRNRLQTLIGLPSLPSLRTISLAQNALSSPVFPLLPSLTSLILDGNPLAALPPSCALSCPRLRHLSLAGCPVDSLADVARLSSLTSLDLSGSAVADLSALADLGLTKLTLDRCNNLAPEALSALPATLVELSIADSGLSVAPLPALPRLKRLALSGNPLQAFPDLTRSPALQALLLDGTGIAVLHGEYVPDLLVEVAIAGSPCAEDEVSRVLLLAALPALELLDGHKPSAHDRAEARMLVTEVFGEGEEPEEPEEEEEETNAGDTEVEVAEAEEFLRTRSTVLELAKAGQDDLDDLLQKLSFNKKNDDADDFDESERLGQLLVRESRERRQHVGVLPAAGDWADTAGAAPDSNQ